MFVLIWQVFWLNPNLIAFPSCDSGRRIRLPNSPFRGLGGFTATGIAPDLHRISLFIPPRLSRDGNQIIANVVREVLYTRRVFNNGCANNCKKFSIHHLSYTFLFIYTNNLIADTTERFTFMYLPLFMAKSK